MWETLVVILIVYSTSGKTSGKKVRCNVKMAAILKMPKYYAQVQSDTRYEKIIPNYGRKSIFHDDDVIYDVTALPQSCPSMFLYEWKMNIFRNNWKPNKGIIIKLGVRMYHGTVNIPFWIRNDYVIDDVIRSQYQSEFRIALTL